MQEHSDEQLVRSFQRGDERAFADFVARHKDRVYRLAVMWLHDPQQADDVLQEALLRCYTGLGRFRFRAAPATWLLRVCRNVCREFNRGRRFERLPEDFSDALAFEPQYEESMMAGRRIGQIRSALATLPERQQQVVALRIFEELSIRETAAVMGCRPGTVKAHLHRALSVLQERLAGQGML